MATKISKYQEIMSRLNDEKESELLDKDDHKKALQAMNEQMEALRKDFQVKEKQSQHSAQNVILNS